jgi:hypothetical protein
MFTSEATNLPPVTADQGLAGLRGLLHGAEVAGHAFAVRIGSWLAVVSSLAAPARMIARPFCVA